MDMKMNMLQNYLGINTQERRENSMIRKVMGETGLHAMLAELDEHTGVAYRPSSSCSKELGLNTPT